MPMLEVKNVNTYYGNIHALKDVSIEVEKGEIVTIIGANGAGKSTMLKTTSGLLRPRSGSIRLADIDLTRLRPHEIVMRGVVQVPEGRRVFGRLTVKENLEMGAFTCSNQTRNQENIERVFAMFPRLKERSTQKAGTLSGGEQQMLAVARGLMAEPVVYMIDELSLGLAPAMSMQLLEALLGLKKSGMTILLVEQNVQMALAISDYGYVLSQGRTDLEGPSRELMKNENIRVAYLGMGSHPG